MKIIHSRAPNYTEEQEQLLRETYSKHPTRETVDALAAKLGKKERSIISKLTHMGIYKAPIKETETRKVVKKADLVAQIENLVSCSMSSLVKANKADLEHLIAFLEERNDS
jgi:predicted transcriptional regulator